MPRSRNKRTRVWLEALEQRTLFSAYYVAPTGNDAGAGSANAPWKTLQHAADAVIAGDTVHVRAGTYAGFSLGWNGPQNGTAASPITFLADAGAIINTCNSRTADGIDLEAASYITVQGFTINNTLGTISRAGIRSVTNNHVVIRGNNIDGAGDWGIFTGFSDDVLIENNVASDSITQHGIYVSNSGDRPTIRGNVVFGNHNCGIHMNGDISQGGDGIISDALVEDNIIYDNGVGGGSGINADGVQGSIFRNNLLYDNLASGISLFCMDGAAGSTNNIITNNTIVEATTARWAINIVDGSTGNAVFNNILDNRNSGHGAINIAADSLSGFTSDDNVIISNRFTPDDGGTMMTLAQWQSATGQDRHSILSTEAGTFANPSVNDFHLRAASTAIGAAAASYTPAADINGNVRPANAADIGAYEYQTATPTPTPIPTPTPTQFTSTATLSSNSQTSGAGETVSFIIIIGGGGSGVPTGTVTFLDGSTPIAACVLDSTGAATLNTQELAAGMHVISVLYSGDDRFLASGSTAVSQMVLAQAATPPGDSGPVAMAAPMMRTVEEEKVVSPVTSDALAETAPVGEVAAGPDDSQAALCIRNNKAAARPGPRRHAALKLAGEFRPAEDLGQHDDGAEMIEA